MRTLLCVAFVVFSLSSAFAWSGYDYENGSFVDIDRGNLVRTGQDIDFYDYNAGEYRTGEVESVRRYGTTVEVEVLDHTTGQIRTFDMDGR